MAIKKLKENCTAYRRNQSTKGIDETEDPRVDTSVDERIYNLGNVYTGDVVNGRMNMMNSGAVANWQGRSNTTYIHVGLLDGCLGGNDPA